MFGRDRLEMQAGGYPWPLNRWLLTQGCTEAGGSFSLSRQSERDEFATADRLVKSDQKG